jgi:SAM-dependent methyltransferase
MFGELSVVVNEFMRQEPLLLESIGDPRTAPKTASWLDDTCRKIRRDIQSRKEIFRDGLMALEGILKQDDDYHGHISDWLRCHCYLYGGLDPKHTATVRDFEIDFLLKQFDGIYGIKKRETDPTDTVDFNLREILMDLYAQFESARDCFRLLSRIDSLARSDHRDSKEINHYWNVSASLSAMFTIDWASFGREELFINNGYRAASWLREEGYVSPSAHILQVGCGIGRIERHLALMAGHVYGADISEEMIQLGKEWLSCHPNVTLFKTDGSRLPLQSGILDTVFSFLVFIHINSTALWHDIFKEAARVLKPSGCYLFTIGADISRQNRIAIESLGERVGLKTDRIIRVNSRRINSFSYEWDWLFVFRKPTPGPAVAPLLDNRL